MEGKDSTQLQPYIVIDIVPVAEEISHLQAKR